MVNSAYINFWIKVKKGGEDTCWLWIAHKNPQGYGIYQGFKALSQYAHRVSYMLTHGKVEKGIVIRHTCDNPSCVNPKHLIAGSQYENVKDCISKGRFKGHLNVTKTTNILGGAV